MEHTDHILVVDDDRDIRELVTGYLEKSGYRATGAANGREMRAVLASQHIDLVVLDIMMPGDDGLTLCRQLRSDTQRNLPVLMLTARSEDTDRILGLEMGADDYLIKPFVARELLARIKAILRRTRALPPNLQITEAGRLIAFGEWQLDTSAITQESHLKADPILRGTSEIYQYETGFAGLPAQYSSGATCRCIWRLHAAARHSGTGWRRSPAWV